MKEGKGKQRHALRRVCDLFVQATFFFLHPFFFVSIFSDVTALEIYRKLRILSK